LLVTGNHEKGQWPGIRDRYSDGELKKRRFGYDMDHMKAARRRLFHEEFSLIWKRELKGITFVGTYPRLA
jgi:hypothetical protein